MNRACDPPTNPLAKDTDACHNLSVSVAGHCWPLRKCHLQHLYIFANFKQLHTSTCWPHKKIIVQVSSKRILHAISHEGILTYTTNFFKQVTLLLLVSRTHPRLSVLCSIFSRKIVQIKTLLHHDNYSVLITSTIM